mmetsp:Transcript_33832/g.63152  ORF Transcript_33832/g.63152 Transcript_33832/m.63152 type:complete len:205 (-) Transcript_33832:46-660(-)
MTIWVHLGSLSESDVSFAAVAEFFQQLTAHDVGLISRGTLRTCHLISVDSAQDLVQRWHCNDCLVDLFREKALGRTKPRSSSAILRSFDCRNDGQATGVLIVQVIQLRHELGCTGQDLTGSGRHPTAFGKSTVASVPGHCRPVFLLQLQQLVTFYSREQLIHARHIPSIFFLTLSSQPEATLGLGDDGKVFYWLLFDKHFQGLF